MSQINRTNKIAEKRSFSKCASFFLAFMLSFVLALSPGLAFAVGSEANPVDSATTSSDDAELLPASIESNNELSTASNEITVFAANDNLFSTSLSGKQLYASVTYDPYFAKDKKTRFTYNVSGNELPLLYKMYSFEIKRDGVWSSVVDSSRVDSLDANNYFETELYSAGEYKLRFYVHEYIDNGDGTKKLGDMVRFAVTFTVDEAGGFETVESVVDRVSTQCLAACKAKGDTSDYAKALWLNDWLVDNADYDGSLQYSSPEGVLLRGSGTCESFHQAYVLLLNKLGIETRRVEDRGDLHVWTGVKMDGKWYNVDVTWNAGKPDSSYYPDKKHLYFGVTTEVMKAVHPAWNGTHLISYYPYATEPFDANSYEDNYFIRSGEISQYSDPYLADTGNYSVKAQLNAGKTSFTLPVVKSGWPDSYKANIYTLVAYKLSKQYWGASTFLAVEYKDGALQFSKEKASIISVDQLNISVGSPEYTGAQLKPKPTVKYGTTVLKEGTDYSIVSYGANTNVSTGGTITVKGLGNFSGTRTVAFKITPMPLSKATITNLSNKTYTGGAITQTPIVKIGNATLPTTDYSVAISSNVQPGNANVTIQARSANYSGSKTATFNIVSKSTALPSVTGAWKKSNGKWWFSYDKATKSKQRNKDWPVNEWVKIGTSVYHFDTAGYMHYGWQKLSGDWYYFGSASDGAMKKNWQRIGGKWYWLDSTSGKMKTEWLTTGGATYYLDASSGAMVTGWREILKDGKKVWFYFNGSGAMQKNRWIGNYYVDSDGVMATDTWIGKYHVNAKGLWDATK